ncbi:MAG TPA: metalloregulator ArsR/SmtB family transcription factor [Flavisolibacter sp.]
MQVTMQMDTLDLKTLELKKASLIFRAINHKLRQQMVKLIHEQGRMTVTQIYIKLRLEQSVASQHLAILRKAGLVCTERDGKFIFYSLNYDRLKQVHDSAGSLV